MSPHPQVTVAAVDAASAAADAAETVAVRAEADAVVIGAVTVVRAAGTEATVGRVTERRVKAAASAVAPRVKIENSNPFLFVFLSQTRAAAGFLFPETESVFALS